VSIPDSASRAELLAALADRDAVIAALLVRIEVLERRVGMDSSNSSMPPGSDGPAARTRRSKVRKKKQSRGPRGGAAGA
jgi:transposase